MELRSVATIRLRMWVLLALQSYFYGIIELRSVATMLNNVTFRAQKMFNFSMKECSNRAETLQIVLLAGTKVKIIYVPR